MDQNNKKKKNFHRHFATPGLNLYWIIIAYIIIGWFYPVIGLIASGGFILSSDSSHSSV